MSMKLRYSILQLQTDGDMLVSETSKWIDNDKKPGLLNWDTRKDCQVTWLAYIMNLLYVTEGGTCICSRKHYAGKDAQHAKLHTFLLNINGIDIWTFTSFWVILIFVFFLTIELLFLLHLSSLQVPMYKCLYKFIKG